MNKKITAFCMLSVMMLLLVGCGRHVKRSTTYYSLINAPHDFYIRLQPDGKFGSSLNTRGDYSIKNGVVSFSDELGGESEGYIDGEYLFYQAYSAGDDRIPDGDRFEALMYDGRRTSVSFHADGTVNYDIVQEGLYDFHLLGTYERNGNIVTCTYDYKGRSNVHTYGIRDGILYDAFSSDESRFDADEIATIERVESQVDDEQVSVLAVVLIVVILMLIFGIVIFAAYYAKRQREKNDKKDER